MWPRVQLKGNVPLVQPPSRCSGARAPDTDHTSRVALRESTAEMLLVFTISARAHSVVDKLSACFAIPSSSPKPKTRRCRSSTSSNKLSPSAPKACSDGPPLLVWSETQEGPGRHHPPAQESQPIASPSRGCPLEESPGMTPMGQAHELTQ